MKLRTFLLFFCSTFFYLSYQYSLAQYTPITLEDIWQKGKYFGTSAEAMRFAKDDNYCYVLEPIADSDTLGIFKIAVRNASRVLIATSFQWQYEGQMLLVEDFQFSPNEKMILLQTATEPIYRRSSKANYYIFDLTTKKIIPLSLYGKQSNPAFSPDGSMVGFTRDNNLFYFNINTQKETAITTDGVKNAIINGSTDWVYEEEFEFAQAYFWSPDSKRMVYYKFDETLVPQYAMQTWGGALYPAFNQYKYPKAGEKNAKVSLAVYSIAQKNSKEINLPNDTNFYIPRVKWTNDVDVIAITKLNRLQNHLEIFHVRLGNATLAKVYEEKNETYIEIHDHLTYLQNNAGFIVSSESSGYRHLYHYSFEGKLVQQITSGDWEIDNFFGINEKTQTLFYTSTEAGETERQLYAVALSGKSKKQLTTDKGMHEIAMSPNFQFYSDQFSTLTQPANTLLYDINGKKIMEQNNNDELVKTIATTQICKSYFFKFKNDGGTSLNAFMIEPNIPNAGSKFPVLIYVYGGPGSQEVKNEWMGPNYAWFQLLAQMGYGIMCVDGRGTGGRGAAFKKSTQNNLGKLEIEDVMAAAKYLGTLPKVDKNRIGIFGWSFGGYMASLAMTVGAEYFKMGIAVAPVVSWRFYDTIYTERFLGLPQDNAQGYDANSPITYAAKLKGAYLLVHGTADDNVHLQNSIEMERALIKAGKQFTSFHYPDKNHGIYGGNTRLHLYQMMTNFIKNNL